jgi:hypothetical protein
MVCVTFKLEGTTLLSDSEIAQKSRDSISSSIPVLVDFSPAKTKRVVLERIPFFAVSLYSTVGHQGTVWVLPMIVFSGVTEIVRPQHTQVKIHFWIFVYWSLLLIHS